MNYPFPTSSPYIQTAISQAVQAIMSGGPLPPNCMVMSLPYQQLPQMLPQLMMNPAIGSADPMMFPQQSPYYNSLPYANNPQAHGLIPQQNYNYPVATYKNNNNKSKKKNHQQPHSNIYNSASFDSYMRHLSWSRLFDHPSHKNSKQEHQDQKATTKPKATDENKKTDPSKIQRSDSSTSSSSTTSDETIRRVNVANKQASNMNAKQQTKGSLPFKYSSEFLSGNGKQQSQNVKPHDAFVVKKP